MARLYGNENFPLPVIETLRQLGHDVLTVLESGHAGQAWPDNEVLAFATRKGRALLTLNRKHFIALHKESPAHAGIIGCTFDADFLAQAARIDQQIKSAGLLNGQLIRVNRPPDSMR
jgi:hypothetical protein